MDYINLDLELSEYRRDSGNQKTFRVYVVRSDFGAMPSDKEVPVILLLLNEEGKQVGFHSQTIPDGVNPNSKRRED